MRKNLLFLSLAFSVIFMASCAKEECANSANDPASTGNLVPKATTVTTTENFEAGSKTAYAAGNVTFATGSWYLNNALTGTTASDRKFDGKSIRVTGTGTFRMNFNATSGAGVVTVYHARYGTDAASNWELWYSTNSGTSWSKAGSTMTSSGTTLVQASFTLNISGNIRFEIRKVSGTSTRLNFDNFAFTDYSNNTAPTQDNNMAMGNPSGAVTNTSYPNNYLMVKAQYALSYNKSRGTANWVSWHLSSAWLGSANASHSFTIDNTLPSAWYHVTTSNYTNTGFDRGHMCPAADRSLNSTDNTATYVMTNIHPQAPLLNQQPWEQLEAYCRTLAGQGNEMYIVDGVLGTGGSGSNGGITTTFASGNVTVPAYCWKSILILSNGSNDVSRVSASTRVITVVMPNTQSANSHPWGYYRVSADYVESQTGWDLWSNVPASIQSSIESVVDTGPTN